MIGEWMAALEAAGLARALRDSVWAYPLVNAGHVLGIALLVGAIVPLDLRLLGLWPSVPLAPLWQVLTRTAACGLLLAIVCGTLLFVTRATEYGASPLFLTKMAIVAAGTANAVALRTVTGKQWRTGMMRGNPPSTVRLAGGLSLSAWLTALALGRLVGYF